MIFEELFNVFQVTVDTSLPLLVLGAVGIFGGLLSLYLPETMDKELPQTLKDGEDFGKGQKMWDLPCIRYLHKILFKSC